MMKIGFWGLIIGCVVIDAVCIIGSNFMFGIRACGLVFSAIMATICMLECIRELEKLKDGEEISDDE